MAEQKKILLAEDDKFISKAYKFGLEKEGYTVDVALNGGQVTDKIKEFKPDLILLDLIMPLKDGFEVLTEIKADPELSKIPVIVLTNLSQEPDIVKAKKLGAVDYLIKSNMTLRQVIENVKFHLVT
ncbi:response regulator [candidate division WWE3 bacterium]|uniref:Response regulator n=1 Tax=candidate division WWE3 bacterium TaxID=2053526 RepID=A0A955LK09_UNCKA|nr:response regulator [candidate division WWE3 bacterium]